MTRALLYLSAFLFGGGLALGVVPLGNALAEWSEGRAIAASRTVATRQSPSLTSSLVGFAASIAIARRTTLNAQTQIETSLASAMASAFAEIEGATKDAQGQVGQQKYKYADLTSVIGAIKPALIKNGLFFTQRPTPSENGITIETVIGHASGEELSLGSLFVPANKNDAQAYGSALTYARRYALVTAFGVPVEDDDGNGAARGQSKSAVSPSRLVNDSEWSMLVQLIEAAGVGADTVCTAANVPSLKQLPADKYESVVRKLNKTIEAKVKENA